MQNIYFDCFSGISGDMIVGALLDLSGKKDEFISEMNKLNMHEEFELSINKTVKNGISATDFDVITHTHHHDEHGHHHHRGYGDICDIIDDSSLDIKTKELSKRIFLRLAKAEAKVHNTTIEEIHFHEVGAVDAIVDIVGASALINMLQPCRIISSPLNDGKGFVKCAHGVIPVPVPAVMQIVSDKKALLNITEAKGEMVTPTGAAIICEIADEFRNLRDILIDKVGYGCGKKEFEHPNLLRVISGTEDEYINVIETNIDDTTPEILGYTMERLFEAGAKDVYFTPIYMKKNRPAYLLSVICIYNDKEQIKDIIFRETSSIGVREYSVSRTKMGRESSVLKTELGDMDIKRLKYNDIEKTTLEFESAKKISLEKSIPISEVYKVFEKSV